MRSNVSRLVVRLVAVAAVLIAAACSADDGDSVGGDADDAASTTSAATTTTEPVDDLAMNDVQVVGSHNSYHLQPSEPLFGALRALLAPLAEAIEYSHLPLTEQLADHGIRQFEIDVFADPEGGLFATRAGPPVIGLPGESGEPVLDEPGFKVLHTQDYDFETTCLTLVACLTEIDTWSQANPTHLPIMVMIEMKDETIEEAAAEEGLDLASLDLDLDFAVPVPTDADVLDALDAEILAIVDRDRIITPDDVRGTHDTLEEAVLTDGWPALGDARGKLLFALNNTGDARDLYRAPSDVLAGRVMFTASEEGQPDAAFIRVDDPIDGGARIRDLVEAGYLVRTRADTPTGDARTGDTTRREAALRSGAQYLSTDYYVANPAFGTGYEVALPGDVVGRCSPARPDAPCPDGDVETG